jgi:hypothetical protein
MAVKSFITLALATFTLLTHTCLTETGYFTILFIVGVSVSCSRWLRLKRTWMMIFFLSITLAAAALAAAAVHFKDEILLLTQANMEGYIFLINPISDRFDMIITTVEQHSQNYL